MIPDTFVMEADSFADSSEPSAAKTKQNDDRGLTHACFDYVSFQEPKPYKPHVDRTVFYPLYVATACLILLPFLPSTLMIVLVTIWAILFVASPVYYFYHFDPLDACCSPHCACKTEHPDAIGAAFA